MSQEPARRSSELPAQGFILDDGEGALQARQIIRLARSHQSNGSLSNFRIKRRHGQVLVPSEHQIAVDLIGTNDCAFAQTHSRHFLQFIAREGTIICSDEIHCDLVFAGHQHLPVASLDPEIAQRTITLMAPSKTYNLAGLQCSFAVIQNEALRKQFRAVACGLLAHINLLGCTAAVAAYSEGQRWLDELLCYLSANRDTTVAYIREHMPSIGVTAPEGTYLAWLDCSNVPALSRPYQFFLKQAHVALSDGRQFGAESGRHVRLN